jgi:arylsulfatase A-like enzyme
MLTQALAMLVLGLPLIGVEAASPPRPNVMLLVSDDLNVDLACYGHPRVRTPNLDRLRAKAMVFEHAYAQYPLCNPSRNSFLSGLYPGTTGCLDNGTPIRAAAPDVVTLPQFLMANGYAAVSSGKVYHHEDPASWSAISNLRTGGLLPMGREPAFYTPPMGDEYRTVGDGRQLVDDTVPWFQWRAVTEGEDYLVDGRTARAVMARLDELAAGGQPFFLATGFSRPHDPYYAPKRCFDLYPLDTLVLPETPDDASPVPDHAFYDVFKRAFEKMNERDKLEAMRAYYAGISYMDEQLGLVLDHAANLGLLENTVIVFMGDHGYQVGEKDYWNKGLLFERSCRTPLLVVAPGMKQAGGRCRRIVELVDLYPTVADLCGLKAPAGLDGTSLTPLLEDPDRDCEERAYTYCNNDRAVRDARFRYIAWKQGGQALYDHQNDPGEHYNLAEDPDYAEVVRRMRVLIASMPEPG